MKKLKTHRYLLVTVMGLLVACTSYTSTDEWPNPRPNSNPDPEPVTGEITSIQSLNKSENVAVNSHADEWGNSSLELDYCRLLTLESPALSAVNALYPRIKKLGDGTYLLLYQQGPQAWNVYYALSTNLITWQNASSPLFQSESAQQTSGASDTRCFSSCDAVVLANKDILAFASFRLNQGYRVDPQSNGIMMRRSSDNGRTWSTAQIIYQGTTWEPYALQLRSGEIQVYFTDSEPLTADSGTAMLRSMDNGRTWTVVGKVIRQKTGLAIDGSGKQIYSDQMPSARELNNSTKIAVATETRFRDEGDVYHISMAWSSDNWASAPLTGDEVGPSDRKLNFVQKAAAPYLVQFPSGETVLSYNASSLFTMQVGNAEASQWGETYQPFSGKGYWGATEIIDPHTLVAAMPATFVNSENKDAARIQIGQFVLNHRINASGMTPVIDADNSDWSAVSDALFIGSVSTTQAVFRFAYDAENVYCLVERLDKDLTTDDSMELIFQGGDATGTPLKISLIPDAVQYTIKCSHSSVTCKGAVHGTFGDTAADKGYVVEMAIPRTLLRVVADRLMFNATLYDQNGNDTFTGLTATNYEKWLPIVLKAATDPEPLPGEGDTGTGPSWNNGDTEGTWK